MSQTIPLHIFRLQRHKNGRIYLTLRYITHVSLVYLQSLPRQRPTVEIHQHVAKRLEVISPALLDADMSVDAGVASRTSQVLVFSIGNVLL